MRIVAAASRALAVAVMGLAAAGLAGAEEAEYVPYRHTQYFACTYQGVPVTMACDMVEKQELQTAVCENTRTRALGRTRLLCYSEANPLDLRIACVVDADVNTSGLGVGDPDSFNNVLCAAIAAVDEPLQ